MVQFKNQHLNPDTLGYRLAVEEDLEARIKWMGGMSRGGGKLWKPEAKPIPAVHSQISAAGC